jgi:hypothetical protein
MPVGDGQAVDDATVAALGKLSEALESVERARGRLYDFHQLTGSADLQLEQAADALEEAGHARFARRLREEVVGRNVVQGRWTFQLVDDYDDGYYALVRQVEREAREELAGGVRHLYEAEMKQRRRTHGRPGHELGPAS